MLTSGSPAEARSKYLKLDDDCPEQGLFLVGSGQVEVHITEVYQNLGLPTFFSLAGVQCR